MDALTPAARQLVRPYFSAPSSRPSAPRMVAVSGQRWYGSLSDPMACFGLVGFVSLMFPLSYIDGLSYCRYPIDGDRAGKIVVDCNRAVAYYSNDDFFRIRVAVDLSLPRQSAPRQACPHR